MKIADLRFGTRVATPFGIGEVESVQGRIKADKQLPVVLVRVRFTDESGTTHMLFEPASLDVIQDSAVVTPQ